MSNTNVESKPKSKSVLDKLKDANLKKVESIEDLPKGIQVKVINSVLDSPCIPVSLKFLIEKYPKNILVDTSQLTEQELNEAHAFKPMFFLDLVMGQPRLTTAVAFQANINSLLAKAYEAFVIQEDNPEYDEFRAECELRYNDLKKMNKVIGDEKQKTEGG